MKNTLLAILCLTLLATSAFAQEKTALKTDQEKASYSLGYKIGLDFRQQGIKIDPDSLVKGMKDSFSGGKTALTEEQMQEALMALQKKVLASQEEKFIKMADENL